MKVVTLHRLFLHDKMYGIIVVPLKCIDNSHSLYFYLSFLFIVIDYHIVYFMNLLLMY